MHLRRLICLATIGALACAVFASAASAQSISAECRGFYSDSAQRLLDDNPSDPLGLDTDNDGVACEPDQPGPPARDLIPNADNIFESPLVKGGFDPTRENTREIFDYLAAPFFSPPSVQDLVVGQASRDLGAIGFVGELTRLLGDVSRISAISEGINNVLYPSEEMLADIRDPDSRVNDYGSLLLGLEETPTTGAGDTTAASPSSDPQGFPSQSYRVPNPSPEDFTGETGCPPELVPWGDPSGFACLTPADYRAFEAGRLDIQTLPKLEQLR